MAGLSEFEKEGMFPKKTGGSGGSDDAEDSGFFSMDIQSIEASIALSLNDMGGVAEKMIIIGKSIGNISALFSKLASYFGADKMKVFGNLGMESRAFSPSEGPMKLSAGIGTSIVTGGK
jgi:hypothetical protein